MPILRMQPDVQNQGYVAGYASAMAVKDSGIDFAATEEFEAVPEERLDALVQEKTKFADWQSMLNAAASQWGERSLSKD